MELSPGKSSRSLPSYQFLQRYLDHALSKKRLHASAKSIASGQPAQSAQADLTPYFLLLSILLRAEGQVYLPVSDKCQINSFTTE